VAQVSHSARDSFAGDMFGQRPVLVVIESTGDIATDKSARNNQGWQPRNFSIRLRAAPHFQITDTKSILKPRKSIAYADPDSYAKSECQSHADCNSDTDSAG